MTLRLSGVCRGLGERGAVWLDGVGELCCAVSVWRGLTSLFVTACARASLLSCASVVYTCISCGMLGAVCGTVHRGRCGSLSRHTENFSFLLLAWLQLFARVRSPPPPTTPVGLCRAAPMTYIQSQHSVRCVGGSHVALLRRLTPHRVFVVPSLRVCRSPFFCHFRVGSTDN